jgi:hypothetical protein
VITTRVSLDEIVAHLEKVRKEHGEEIFQTQRMMLAKQVILGTNGETFLKNAWPDLDLEEVRQLAVEEQQQKRKEQAQDGLAPEQMMLKMLQQQAPNVKTQGQLQLYMAAFNALSSHINAVFGGQEEAAKVSLSALNQCLEMAPKIAMLSEQVEQIPEEKRSQEAQDFMGTPKQFEEEEICEGLLKELEGIDSPQRLQQWYGANQGRRDRIVSQNLRNKFLDAVRQKRRELAN